LLVTIKKGVNAFLKGISRNGIDGIDGSHYLTGCAVRGLFLPIDGQ
jgi:hypothetical protein